MKTEVFVEFFLARLDYMLNYWKEIGVNDILRLPKWFNLQALYDRKGGVFPLNDLRKMIAEVSEKASADELEGFFRGLIAAIRLLDLSIDFDEKDQVVQKRKESRGEAGQAAEKGEGGFPKSERMQTMAEAWQAYSPGPSGETLRQTLARSLNTFEGKEWNNEMTKALKAAGTRKIQVGYSDQGNFRNSAALRGLLKSKSGL
ncbi:MAG: hypothetical protein WC528_03730 [Patescibacteria group bacterium]